jgi:hypothetical protein
MRKNRPGIIGSEPKPLDASAVKVPERLDVKSDIEFVLAFGIGSDVKTLLSIFYAAPQQKYADPAGLIIF